MTEVVIHQCSLRLVRRGGWSWGPDPKRLVEQLVRSVPRLLEKKLGLLLADDVDAEITEPIAIRIPIRISDLELQNRFLSAEPPDSGEHILPQLASRLEYALCEILTRSSITRLSDQIGTHPAQRAPKSTTHAAEVRIGPRNVLARLFLRLHENNRLELFLAASSEGEIARWNQVLRDAVEENEAPAAADDSGLPARVSDFLFSRSRSFVPASDVVTRRGRILLAIESAAKFSVPPSHPAIWQALDRLLPIRAPDSHASSGLSGTLPDTAGKHIAKAEAQPADVFVAHPFESTKEDADEKRREQSWDVQVPCALPFLLLSPLAAVGFFDAVCTALEAARIPDAISLIAGALAYKLLDPPERGWRRTPASLASAAAFAGRRFPVEESSLVETARQMEPHTGILERILQSAVRTAEYVVCRADEGHLVCDAQGCLPVGWCSTPESVVRLVSRPPNALVNVAASASDPDLLARLNRSGMVFVVDAIPARGESWQRVSAIRENKIWSNHCDCGESAVVKAALHHEARVKDANELWNQMGQARVAAIRSPWCALDRALTLAAGVALGTIAWELWRERGRTTPQLALERLGDLNGYVRFSPDRVVIRLPLGRRHQELHDHRLLSPVAGIPWLGGRRVEFEGG